VYHALIASFGGEDTERSLQLDLIAEIAKLSFKSMSGSWLHSDTAKLDVCEVQLKLLHDWTAAGIEPAPFDLMLSSELDRTLKKQFGVAFLLATIAFTAASYAVIIFNAVNKWVSAT
jgi:hypothetical protein